MTQTRKSFLFNAIALGVYVAVTFAVAWRHEPWRDEADAWLAARDMTFGQLWSWLAYAGTPGLWYWLVMPLAKLGLPYFSMTVVHLLIADIVAAIILFRAPFPPLVRVAIIFSYHLAYEYAVISRAYGLTVLFLLLTACLFPRRFQRAIPIGILLALLANTNVHGFFLAIICLGALLADAIVRRRFSWKVGTGAGMAFLGAMLAFIQLLPPRVHPQLAGTLTLRNPDAIIALLCRTFFPAVPHRAAELAPFVHSQALAVLLLTCGSLFGSVVLVMLILYLRTKPQALFIFCASLLAMLYVFVVKWYGGDRHTGIVLLVALFALWLAKEQSPGEPVAQSPRRIPRPLAVALIVSLIFSDAMFAAYAVLDWRYSYSGSYEAAQMIRTEGLSRRTLVAFPDPIGSAILPYLGSARLWYAGRREYGTYMHWDAGWMSNYKLPSEVVLRRMKDLHQDPSTVVLILGQPLPTSADNEWRLVFTNRTRIFRRQDERYFIYEHQPVVSAQLDVKHAVLASDHAGAREPSASAGNDSTGR